LIGKKTTVNLREKGVKQNRCLRPTNFLCDKFAGWACNGSGVERIWNKFKNIVCESIERLVVHKTLRKNRTTNITTRKLND